MKQTLQKLCKYLFKDLKVIQSQINGLKKGAIPYCIDITVYHETWLQFCIFLHILNEVIEYFTLQKKQFSAGHALKDHRNNAQGEYSWHCRLCFCLKAAASRIQSWAPMPSVWNLNILPVTECVSSRCSGFFSQTNNLLLGSLIGFNKLVLVR